MPYLSHLSHLQVVSACFVNNTGHLCALTVTLGWVETHPQEY